MLNKWQLWLLAIKFWTLWEHHPPSSPFCLLVSTHKQYWALTPHGQKLWVQTPHKLGFPVSCPPSWPQVALKTQAMWGSHDPQRRCCFLSSSTPISRLHWLVSANKAQCVCEALAIVTLSNERAGQGRRTRSCWTQANSAPGCVHPAVDSACRPVGGLQHQKLQA